MKIRHSSAGFFIILILYITTDSVSSNLPLARLRDWPQLEIENGLKRERRQANTTDGQPDSNTRCVIRNLKDIEHKLEKSLPPEKNISKAAALAKPHQLFSNADPATVEKFCEIYKSSRARLAACGESQMKSFAAKALAVVDFICIDRYEDFIAAFPCIQKIDEESDARCQANCSTYESSAERLNSAGASIVKKYSQNEIKELFAQSCLYVRCVMECQKPLLEAKCGGKVAELEMSSIGVTFRNLDEMMKESSAYTVWPAECKPLSSMGSEESHSPILTQTTLPPVQNVTSNSNSTSPSSPGKSTIQPSPTSSAISTGQGPLSNSTVSASNGPITVTVTASQTNLTSIGSPSSSTPTPSVPLGNTTANATTGRSN